MKLLIALGAAVCVLAGLPRAAHAQDAWAQVSGCATWITQDVSGKVYTASCSTGADKSIYRRDTGWTLLSGLTGVQISAYDSNSIWVRKSNGTTYYRSGSSWVGPIAFGGGNACSTYVAAGPNNSLYALGCDVSIDKSIWKRDSNGTWTRLNGYAKQIVVVADGTPWVKTSSGTSWYWNGTGWSSVSGTTNQLVTGAAGQYAAKGVNDGWIYEWYGSSWLAELAPTPNAPTKLFTSASHSSAWAINTANEIFAHYFIH